MTQQSSGPLPGSGTGVRTDPGTTGVARDEVAEVGRTTADAGKDLAGTAAEQATQVAEEAKTQARDLVGEARTQVRSQAQVGQQKAADTLRGLADELHQMAQSGSQSGLASDVVRQAADKLTGVADWIGKCEPGDVLEEIRGFARRRPGMFLLGAAAAGVLAGRLTRGAAAASGGSEQGIAPQPEPYGRPEAPPPPPSGVPAGPVPAGAGAPGGIPAGGPQSPSPYPPVPPPPAGPPPVPPGQQPPPAYPPPGPNAPGQPVYEPERGSAGWQAQGGPR